jgi:signal peptidase I
MENYRKKQYLETSGFSMWPFLKQDDRVIIEEVNIQELRAGDIVLYNTDNQSVCHRLVGKRSSAGKYFMLTRGDYVPSWKTETIDGAHLKGRVSAIIRGKKIIPLKGIWNAAAGRIIILAFPLVAFAVASAVKILKKR